MAARWKKWWVLLSGIALLLVGAIAFLLPEIGAAMILHPPRKGVAEATPGFCKRVAFQREGLTLHGWRSDAVGARRGTVIYLHGLADNRVGGAGVIERFRKRGFDVVAFDSRAHGASGGHAVTYGFFEKEDLRAVINTLEPGPVVLIGSSLGAAVALQLAADDKRVSAVVAGEAFSDLRTVITERAPFCFSTDRLEEAIRLAERKGKFSIDSVNPALAARKISVPVLLIHGEDDSATQPEHSRRIFGNLGGAKTLMLIPGAGHNESMQGDIWKDIEQWIDTNLGEPTG